MSGCACEWTNTLSPTHPLTRSKHGLWADPEDAPALPVGTYVGTWKITLQVRVPLGVTTLTVPAVAPLGTVQVML